MNGWMSGCLSVSVYKWIGNGWTFGRAELKTEGRGRREMGREGDLHVREFRRNLIFKGYDSLIPQFLKHPEVFSGCFHGNLLANWTKDMRETEAEVQRGIDAEKQKPTDTERDTEIHRHRDVQSSPLTSCFCCFGG